MMCASSSAGSPSKKEIEGVLMCMLAQRRSVLTSLTATHPREGV
jgi:hypothetical protein